MRGTFNYNAAHKKYIKISRSGNAFQGGHFEKRQRDRKLTSKMECLQQAQDRVQCRVFGPTRVLLAWWQNG
jgi:hypothetical protein